MRIQFASDLHLNSWQHMPEKEKGFERVLQPIAKTLVLAGDIGHPDSITLRVFMKWCSKRWENIFWIPGHHEMTDVWHLKNRTYDECLSHMRVCVAEYPNIQVLHRDSFITDDGFLFLACPLWARLTAMSNEMSKDPICQDITKHYEEDLAWLREQIRKAEIPVVVASHYPPTYTMMDPQNMNNAQSVPFALETEALLRPPVVGWICGYAHKANIVERPLFDAEGRPGKIILLCNPLGYPDDPPTGYRPDAVLRLMHTPR